MLIGKGVVMSFTRNLTHDLWKDFMPRRKEINGLIGIEVYSVQHYAADFYTAFNPERLFKKWAAVKVGVETAVPEGMDHLTLTGGLYAVFEYKGAISDAAETFRYIIGVWLPQSPYLMDNSRHHFEILGEKYSNEGQDSEEEIWIPILKK